MIDATQHHDPALAPGLIEAAIARTGSQQEVAKRCGVSARYLRQLSHGERVMSYGVQVMLEGIIRES